MASELPEAFLRRCRRVYAWLLCLYPKAHRDRFAQGMAQTFNDLCRERAQAGRGVVGFALWIFFETAVGVIKEHFTKSLMHNKRVARVALGTGLLLLIPLWGNHFVEGWNWPPSSFVAAGVLLFSVGLAFELLLLNANTTAYRIAAGLTLGGSLFLLWVNAAVGIIGDHNPANLMFLGVPLVGVIGAVAGRFKPRGMARALFAMALAQALVPVVALILWSPRVVSWSPGVLPVFGLNTFFVLLFVGAAFLFRRAAAHASTSP